jgi:hypothetical protein
MAPCRTIDAVTPIDFGRQGPPAAIHHGSIDRQGARANEVGTVAAVNGSGCLIAKGSYSQISRVKIATHKYRWATAVTPARPSTNPCYTAGCTDIAATPAIVRVSLSIDFTAVGSATIAVSVAGAASDTTGTARAGSSAVIARASRATGPAISRVRCKRFFTAVGRTAITVAVQVGTSTHSTAASGASRRCVRI